MCKCYGNAAARNTELQDRVRAFNTQIEARLKAQQTVRNLWFVTKKTSAKYATGMANKQEKMCKSAHQHDNGIAEIHVKLCSRVFRMCEGVL